jgi:hypothetical protein
LRPTVLRGPNVRLRAQNIILRSQRGTWRRDADPFYLQGRVLRGTRRLCRRGRDGDPSPKPITGQDPFLVAGANYGG